MNARVIGKHFDFFAMFSSKVWKKVKKDEKIWKILKNPKVGITGTSFENLSKVRKCIKSRKI